MEDRLYFNATPAIILQIGYALLIPANTVLQSSLTKLEPAYVSLVEAYISTSLLQKYDKINIKYVSALIKLKPL